MNNLYLEILPKKQKDILKILAQQKWVNEFYLAGGTALALQIGHRQSIDFDFFIPKDFDSNKIFERLNSLGLGEYQLQQQDKNTLNGYLNNIQISFFTYRYKVVKPFIKYQNFNLLDIFDIALMKLEAISGRGSKKDFIDLYFLLEKFDLHELFSNFHLKYGKGRANQYHMLKSLNYFDDAEQDKAPVMIKDVSWEKVKEKINLETKILSKILYDNELL